MIFAALVLQFGQGNQHQAAPNNAGGHVGGNGPAAGGQPGARQGGANAPPGAGAQGGANAPPGARGGANPAQGGVGGAQPPAANGGHNAPPGHAAEMLALRAGAQGGALARRGGEHGRQAHAGVARGGGAAALQGAGGVNLPREDAGDNKPPSAEGGANVQRDINGPPVANGSVKAPPGAQNFKAPPVGQEQPQRNVNGNEAGLPNKDAQPSPQNDDAMADGHDNEHARFVALDREGAPPVAQKLAQGDGGANIQRAAQNGEGASGGNMAQNVDTRNAQRVGEKPRRAGSLAGLPNGQENSPDGRNAQRQSQPSAFVPQTREQTPSHQGLDIVAASVLAVIKADANAKPQEFDDDLPQEGELEDDRIRQSEDAEHDAGNSEPIEKPSKAEVTEEDLMSDFGCVVSLDDFASDEKDVAMRIIPESSPAGGIPNSESVSSSSTESCDSDPMDTDEGKIDRDSEESRSTKSSEEKTTETPMDTGDEAVENSINDPQSASGEAARAPHNLSGQRSANNEQGSVHGQVPPSLQVASSELQQAGAQMFSPLRLSRPAAAIEVASSKDETPKASEGNQAGTQSVTILCFGYLCLEVYMLFKRERCRAKRF